MPAPSLINIQENNVVFVECQDLPPYYLMKNGKEINHLYIRNTDDLKNVFDLLHDGSVDLNLVRMEGDNLSMFVRRENTEGLDYKLRNYFIFKTFRPLLILGHLSFENVNSYKVINDQGIAVYSFDWFNLENNILTVEFNEVTTIQIEFKGTVTGYLADIECSIKCPKEYGMPMTLPFWYNIPKE